MEILRRKVRSARRRLAVERLLRVLPWCLFATLLLAAIGIGVGRYWSLGPQPAVWIAGAAAAAVILACGRVFLDRASELDAAIEIDRRFELKERVSSAYALAEPQRETAAGRAVVDDALAAIGRVEIASAFRPALDRWALLPLGPAVAAFLVALLVNPAGDSAVATTEGMAQKQQVKKSSEILEKKLEKQQQEAREKGLKDAEELLTKLQEGTKQLAKGDDDRRQALVKLNDLAKELEKRRQEVGGGERLQEQLDQLKNLQRGPAAKLAGALRDGDMKRAAAELNKLAEQLEKGLLDEQAKADLAKQLHEMQDKLAKIAEKHRKLQEDLQAEVAKKRAAGKSKEADELEKQLAKLKDQAPQMQQLDRMADKLGQCAECAANGDAAGAKQALASLSKEVGQLQEQLAEAELLDSALDELAEAKESMACKACNGEGCAACNGRFGQGRGNGLGRGQGEGDRPEEKTETGFYDSKVRQQLGRGEAVITGRVDGPNIKGRVEQEIQTQFDAARGNASDPLADQKLPRGYREHARKYFDTLREGEK